MWTVDRIENNIAVILYRNKSFDLPLEILPEGIKEGDIIELTIDNDKKKSEIIKNQKKMDSIFKKK